MEDLYCFSRNDIGIDAVNSNLIGGLREGQGEAVAGKAIYLDATQLFSELNTEAGIRLNNSVLDYSGRLLLDGNYFGLHSINSDVKTDKISARYNQSTGLKLEDSQFTYNKDLYANYYHNNPAQNDVIKEAQVACIFNGQDITCNKSVMQPVYTSSMPAIYDRIFTSGSFGVFSSTLGLAGSNSRLPSIEANNNSNVDLIHARLLESTGSTKVSNGIAGRSTNNSTITLRGSSEYANILAGPLGRANNNKLSALYANNGSTIKLQGPTSIFRFGVDVLAENNSNIEITPHQNAEGELLVSAFDLQNGFNHTMVELHSTNACLVANKNSTILMENLGDYQSNWLTSEYASGIFYTGGGGYTFSNGQYANYASSGYLQFYPNADTVSLDNAPANANNISVDSSYNFQSVGGPSPMIADLIYPGGTPTISAVTTGGMCLRALGNSTVDAHNVHFPQDDFDNASSVIYDYYGNEPLAGPKCSRIHIWNIADNSLLRASYLSVEGTHPRDAGYYGPSGQWGSSEGAPSSTPDTSGISILDYYGHSDDNPFGKSASAENFGPFRLYFSVDPAANFLVASGDTSWSGVPRQLFAQGYPFSGSLIASSYGGPFEPSAQYTSLLQRNVSGDIHASGFYYVSSMMFSPNTVKAYLDDSALNTFANAKHNTVGKSGLAKVVLGYYDTNNGGGETGEVYTLGVGFKSPTIFDIDSP
jgi:hypothetical protein